MSRALRRVVTGTDAEGRSAVVSDSLVCAPAGLWLTPAAPASNAAPDALPDGPLPFLPLAGSGGTLLLVADISPAEPAQSDPAALRQAGLTVTPDRLARHPHFHATDTLDYCVCLEGEVCCVLDDGEAVLQPGDVLVQRGTQHAWVNRTDRPARMLFVLVDAEPLP